MRSDGLAVYRENGVTLSINVRPPAPATVGQDFVVDVKAVNRRQVSHAESVAREESDAK
jgi:hypothetical protein